MVSIGYREAVPHQLSPQTLPLESVVDAKPREIPVRKQRMGFAHAIDNREDVLMLLGRDALGEGSNDGIAVRLLAWRQPESHGGERAQTPRRFVDERFSAESRKERREMRLVLQRFRKEPRMTGSYVNAETRVSNARPTPSSATGEIDTAPTPSSVRPSLRPGKARRATRTRANSMCSARSAGSGSSVVPGERRWRCRAYCFR